MDADKLKGMTIVSIADAARLGRIAEVLFETQPLRVAAFTVAGRDTEFVIPFEQVRNVGADAVTVESSQVTQAAGTGSSFGSLPGLANLQKLKVVDEAGTYVGTIETVELDPATGRVSELVARRGGILGVGGARARIVAKAIRSVGPEVLTITKDGARPSDA